MRERVLDIAIEPKSRIEAEKLRLALDALTSADPEVGYKADSGSGQVILSASDELQLDHFIGRLKGERGIAVNIGTPQVAYREAITRTVVYDYTHKKQSGGAGQFARIRFRIEPNEPGAGFAFTSEVATGNVPTEYIPGVEKGVESVMGAGPIIGFPMVDVKFTLIDGGYHDVDSSVLAFEIAGRVGFREAIEKAAPRILEPIMRIEVTAPGSVLGDIIGNLNSRRGQIVDVATGPGNNSIVATVPLSTMFGYVNSLRAMTAGAGRYRMTFSHYAEVPVHHGPDDRFPPAMAMAPSAR